MQCNAEIFGNGGIQVGVAIGLKPEVWLDIHEVGGIYEFNADFTKKIGLPGLNRKQIQCNFPDYLLPDGIGDDGWWNKSAETLPRNNSAQEEF